MTNFYDDQTQYYDDIEPYYADSEDYYENPDTNIIYNETPVDINTRLRVLPGGFIDYNKESYQFEGAGGTDAVDIPDPAWPNSVEIWAVPPGGIAASYKWLPGFHYTLTLNSDGYAVSVSPVVGWPTRVRFLLMYNTTET